MKQNILDQLKKKYPVEFSEPYPNNSDGTPKTEDDYWIQVRDVKEAIDKAEEEE